MGADFVHFFGFVRKRDYQGNSGGSIPLLLLPLQIKIKYSFTYQINNMAFIYLLLRVR